MTEITPTPAKRRKVKSKKVEANLFETTPVAVSQNITSEFLTNTDLQSILRTSRYNAATFETKMNQRLSKLHESTEKEIKDYLDKRSSKFGQGIAFSFESADSTSKMIQKVLDTPESKDWKRIDALHRLLGEAAFLNLLTTRFISQLTYAELKQLLSEITQPRFLPDILVELVRNTPQLTLTQRLKLFNKYLFKAIKQDQLLIFNQSTLEKWQEYEDLLQHWSNKRKEKLYDLVYSMTVAQSYDEESEDYNQMNKEALVTLRNILFGRENEASETDES